jgi:hydrogenase expression/formation protein HypD
MLEFRNQKTTEKLIKEIEKNNLKRDIKIMHVCGTHEMTLVRWGLRSILPKNIKLICGPGCPVCVTSASEIDFAIELAKERNIVLTTFGDMFRVPGTCYSLSEAKSQGADVRIIYGIDEVAKIARKTDNEVVHFSVGFETTTPMIASEILENHDLKNLSIICSHYLIPPAMEHLLSCQDFEIDGFICPGHVSTIIGCNPYARLVDTFSKPMVISGFEPNDMLLSILMILKQMNDKEFKVENEYARAVKKKGNVVAQRIMDEVFEKCEKGWRGIGIIPNSGLRLKKKFAKFDARKKFGMKINKSRDIKPGCKCGEIIKGKAEPGDCPYYGKACTPGKPIGACMVSVEGACYINYTYSCNYVRGENGN